MVFIGRLFNDVRDNTNTFSSQTAASYPLSSARDLAWASISYDAVMTELVWEIDEEFAARQRLVRKLNEKLNQFKVYLDDE